jgi:hypothetical protein
MIDSTGLHYDITIECAYDLGCMVRLPLPLYKPEHGHCGEKLDEGPYFDSCSHNDYKDLMHVFESGRVFNVVSIEPSVVEVCFIHPSGASYAYNGALMPKFGLKRNQHIWVCKRCIHRLRYSNHPWTQVLDLWETEHKRSARPCLTNICTRWWNPD